MKILRKIILASILLASTACGDIRTQETQTLEDKSSKELIEENSILEEESTQQISEPEILEQDSDAREYVISKLDNPRLKYYMLEKKWVRGEWPSELWAVLDTDKEIQVPYPDEDVDDIRMYALGDINGNGFEEIIISVGGMGSCCLPNYTIASFDGNSFKLSKTMEWVEDYEITEENGKTHFEFLLPEPNLRKEKYVYEDYNLKPLKTQKAKTYKVIRELTITEFFEHERSKSEEYLAMDYVKNDTEHLQIIALPETYKSLRFVLYNPIKDEMLLAFQIPDYASSIGISEEEIDSYPVLIINNVYRLTKDGELLNKEVEY